ncbi:protein of unknown function [Burkholderia multivorans]
MDGALACLSQAQLLMLLEGIDWQQPRTHGGTDVGVVNLPTAVKAAGITTTDAYPDDIDALKALLLERDACISIGKMWSNRTRRRTPLPRPRSSI